MHTISLSDYEIQVDRSKLPAFGFREKDGVAECEKPLDSCGFCMKIILLSDALLQTEVYDISTGEAYVLHLVERAEGAFVQKVRKAHDEVLSAFFEACCIGKRTFESDQTKAVLEYIRQVFGDELTYPWAKTGDMQNAVVRRKDNDKWYAVFLTVDSKRFGFPTGGRMEVVNLKLKPERIAELLRVKRNGYFQAYHMNKKHWITVPLNYNVPTENLMEDIRESYFLAGGKKQTAKQKTE